MNEHRTHEAGGSGVSPRMIFGLSLIALGCFLILDRLEILEWDDLVPYFLPAVLILVGLGKTLWPASSSGRALGLVMLVAGLWLLLYQVGILRFSFWSYWPVLLILGGAWIAWQALSGSERSTEKTASALLTPPSPREGEEPPRDDVTTVNAIAMLGGAKRSSNTSDFRGGDYVAFMGSCEIDLRNARIRTSPAVIDAFAFWGGVEIRVPEDWSVEIKGVPLLGGYEDNSTPPPTRDQRLVVKGFAIMGGVEVKN